MSKINESNFLDYKISYEKNGYVIIENVFDHEKCDEIKSISDKYADPPDYGVVLNLHRKNDYFFKLISNKDIVKLIKHIQDSDIDAVNDQFLFKKANSKYGRQSWTFHQDNSYVRAPKGTYIIVHIAVDKSVKENGGLIFLPGSHLEEILEFKHNKSWREESNQDNITRPGQSIVNVNEMIKKYPPIDVIFPKGSVCLMHGNIIHGSHPNLSTNHDRNQYSMCYLNRDVKFLNQGKNSKKIRTALY